MATRQPRERSTGRYGFDGQFDRVCTCGHTLGNHTAVAPHSCIEGDFSDVSCDCAKFRPAKVVK